MAHLFRAQGLSVRHRLTAVPGAEDVQEQHHIDPAVGRRLEHRLVVDTVQAPIHAQIELVALAVAAHLQAITHRARITQSQRRVAYGSKSTTVVGRDLAFEHGMAIGVKRHPAGRYTTHDPVVDGSPAFDSFRGVELKGEHGQILASSRYTGFQTPIFKGNLMFNISDFLSNLETTQHLLDCCYDFRGAVLLTPDEMTLAARQRDITLAPGWGIRSVLSADEVEDLYGGRAPSVQVAVQQWLPDLPCLMLEVPCRSHHFMWVVPLWEEGARDWLETVVAQGRFTLLVDAQGGSRSIATTSHAPRDCNFEALRKVATVRPMASMRQSVEAMVMSGFRAMLDRTSNPQDPQRALRTMVVARDGHAQPVLETFLRSADLGNVMLKMARQDKPVYH